MTSLIRLLLIVFITIDCSNLEAKETFCYKLTSSSDSSIKIGGVQFMSFIGDQCYESSSNGVKIHDGKLNKNSYLSSSNVIVYTGKCFCGNGAKFEFSPDKTSLTVTSKDGHRFKFVKISPPKDVKTSSYQINNNTSPNPQYNGGYDYGTGANPQPTYNSPSCTIQNNSSSQSNSQTQQTNTRRCVYCNGTGRIEKNDNAPANFGTDRPKQRCNECGKWYDPDVFTHYHQQCRQCSGTGYAK